VPDQASGCRRCCPTAYDPSGEQGDGAGPSFLRKLDESLCLSRFTTWAHKFVISEVSSTFARHARRRQPPSKQLDWDRIPGSLPLRPGNTLDETAELKVLVRAIRELTERQRDVFVAIALNDVPIDVLALQLGSNRDVICKNFLDARRTLRNHLATAGYPVEEVPT
jgi:RNA polymerase sigma-70 factor, ECF subfamily